MSGDLAPNTGRDTVKLFEIIGTHLPPGLIQLVEELMENTWIFKENNFPDGIAFGSSARKIMQPYVKFANENNKRLYEYPQIMSLAIRKQNTTKSMKVI